MERAEVRASARQVCSPSVRSARWIKVDLEVQLLRRVLPPENGGREGVSPMCRQCVVDA
jgi:hypothetical protein